MAALSFLLSFYLRVGDGVFAYSWKLLLGYDLAFAAIAAGVFWWTGLYRGIWRYASLPDLLGLLRAVSVVVLLFFPAMFMLTRLDDDGGLAHVLERGDAGIPPMTRMANPAHGPTIAAFWEQTTIRCLPVALLLEE